MNKELARYALQGLQAEMSRLESRLAELREQQAALMKAAKASSRELSEGTSPSLGTSRTGAVRKRRGMSEEGRERIRQAQMERWARSRAAKEVAAPPNPDAADGAMDASGASVAAAKGARKRGRKTTGNRKK